MTVSIPYASPAFGAMQIVESLHITTPFEDWSRVRSPARAARRLKRGFRQNIVYGRRPHAVQINGVIHAHPEIVRQLRDAALRQANPQQERGET